MGRHKIPQSVKLATKALKNGPKWKPAKGYKYLEDLEPGAMFMTSAGMKGILIEAETNAKVIIMDVNVHPNDVDYYLGKQIIASKTEIKEL